jgi:hypothetical protein
LEATVSIPVSAPEEPDMALARGAALASANAPLFASSTAALAYAQDPGTGEVNPNVLAPAYLDVSANARLGDSALAYSALADEEVDEGLRAHRPFLLASSGAAAAILIGIVALAISLVADVGPVGQRTSPSPRENAVPTKQVPAPPSAHAPAVAAPGSSAPPAAPPPSAAPPPPPAQTITAPTPVVHQLPQQAVTPNPVYRAPTRQAPVYVPPPAADQAPPPAAPPPPPPAAPPPAPPEPRLPPMVMYLHLPFVTIPIPINPPPPPPPPPPGP